MDENTNGSRLPPPAFPPGVRRHAARSVTPSTQAGDSEAADGVISPDDPLPTRPDPIGAAFISPDEPLPERRIELAPEFQDDVMIEPGEEGIVVGMDMDDHLEHDEVISGGDPHVMEVMSAVAKLAEALHHHGEAGLKASHEMSRFEATLRSYCVGYLAGRRAEEPAPPVVEEPLPTDG